MSASRVFATGDLANDGVAIRQPQPPCGIDLFQVPLLDPVQRLQPLPLSGAQLDPLLCHGASQPPEKRTFLLCTNRTFSFCGDMSIHSDCQRAGAMLHFASACSDTHSSVRERTLSASRILLNHGDSREYGWPLRCKKHDF